MATRISPPQNKTYYINPAYLTFVENSGYGANLIQVSASSSCYISVYDPANGIGYSDADRNYQRWKVTAYNNKFPDNEAWYIYVRLERSGTSALVMYDKVLRGVKGGEITVSKDENGNDVYTEAESTQDTYWVIKIGEVGATDGTSIRGITYDTGYLTSDEGRDTAELNDMWELDKYSTPWLIRAKQWLQSFTVKGFITLMGGLLFKNGEDEKPVKDIKRSIDSDNEYLLAEDGNVKVDEQENPIPDPNYVPVSDETLPTTKYLHGKLEGFDDKYLRKDQDDRTAHSLSIGGKTTAEGGIQIGAEFASGLTGYGANIDEKGQAELHSLFVRTFLEVPELRYNRITVRMGDEINSVSAGVIERVEPAADGSSTGTLWLKLEDGEFGSLEPDDLVMQIFSDMQNPENNAEENSDDGKGNRTMKGFATVYFEVVSVSGERNEKIEYKLREDAKQIHPYAMGPFSQRGNLSNPERQTVIYQGIYPKPYTRYMTGVNQWEFTFAMVGMQLGDLSNMSAFGQNLSGYSAYLNNVYYTGFIFELTPQQKAEISAYSVSLSEYVGSVRVDSEGNVIAGEYTPVNVVTGEENVVTGGENVVTGEYLLQTRVQAFKGETELAYTSGVPESGQFTCSISAVGCTAGIANGVISITSVENFEYCYVKVETLCEGKTTFYSTYQVKVIKDGISALYADIDNEMDSVACDENGKVLFGLPVSCNVSAWYGQRKLDITAVGLSVPEGVSAMAAQDSEGNYTGKVNVTGISDTASDTLQIGIDVYAELFGKTESRGLTFTVNKVKQGESAVLYKLLPSVDSVKVNDAGEPDIEGISCRVLRVNALGAQELDSLDETGLSMQYRIDKNDFIGYAYGDVVAVTEDMQSVSFRLYLDGVLMDAETVPVVKDGNAIKQVGEFYLATSYGYGEGVTREDGEWGTWVEGFIPELSEEKRYLWNYEVISYTGTEPTYTEPAIIAMWTKDGKGVKDVYEWYQVNDDKDNVPAYPHVEGDAWVKGTAPVMREDAKYLWNYEEILWTDGSVTYTEPAMIGAKGETGATTPVLTVSHGAVSRNSLGSFDPATVIVSVRRGMEEEELWISAFGIRLNEDGTEDAFYIGNSGAAVSRWNVELKGRSVFIDENNISSVVFRAYLESVNDYNTPAVAEQGITFVQQGEVGETGPMPRNRGQYDGDKEYFYNDEYRDYVWDSNGFVWIRQGRGITEGTQTKGAIKGIQPSTAGDTEYWAVADRMSLTAIDTALIDEANIAGFMYKDGMMVSQERDENVTKENPLGSKIVINGNTGYLKCEDADVTGIITAGVMSYKILYGTGGEYDLTGYGMGVGSGTYILPSASDFEALEIRMLCVNFARSFLTFKIKTTDGTPIYVRQKNDYMAEVFEAPLGYNTIYTLSLVYDDWQQQMAWMISEGIGGSTSGDLSIFVDEALDEDSKNPVQNKVITAELKKYVTLEEDEEITGGKNFTGGLQVNGSPIVYDSSGGYWKLDGDLLVTGGVTMYGSDTGFVPSTVMDAIRTDGTTIRVNPTTKRLEVIGGTGGGLDQVALEDYLESNSYLTRPQADGIYATPSDLDDRIDSLVNGAPAAYDTLKEIADVLEKNVDSIDDILKSIGGKADKATTLAGYGITDAKISNGVITLGDNTITPLTQTTGDGRYLLKSTYTASDILTKLKTVDGASSGLDADTLDGLHATKFPLLNAVYGSGDDLDDATRAGYYNVSVSSNIPSGVYSYGMLETIEVYSGVNNDSENRLVQVYYPHYSSSAYGHCALAIRFRNAGTWTDWRKVVTEYGNVASATKATQDSDGNVIKDTYLKLTGGTMKGTILSQAIYPTSSNAYSLGASESLWSNLFTKKVTVDGIGLYKSQEGVLYLDGNLVVKGGVTVYGDNSVTASTIMDAIKVDDKTISKANGYLEVVGGTGGGLDQGALEDYLDSNGYLTKTEGDSKYLLKASYTAADILSKMKEVDGASSGLDADLLDGLQGSSYARSYGGASVDASLTGVGYDNGNYGSAVVPAAGGFVSATQGTYGFQLFGGYTGNGLYYRGVNNKTFTSWQQVAMTTSNVASATKATQDSDGNVIKDTYLKSASYTAADVLAKLKTVDGADSGLDADTVDGMHASSFARYYGGASVDESMIGVGYDNSSNGSVGLPMAGGFISATQGSYGMQLLGNASGGHLYFRGVYNRAFSDWKQVAFTDSDITGNAETATTASKLSTVSKTAWGQTYWTSGGVPTSISGDMTNVGFINGSAKFRFDNSDTNTIEFSSGHKVVFGGVAGYANQSYYFRPMYGGSSETTASVYIQKASASSSSPTYTSMHYFDGSGNAYHKNTLTTGGTITSGGNIVPATTSTYTLGTSSNGYKAYYAQGSNADVGFIATGSSYKLGFVVGSGNENRGIYDYTNSSWMMYRGASTDIYFPSGNIGFGTISPSYKVHINGNTGFGSHIYLTGANASSSTGNTSQIVFGTPTDQHVTISSNANALIINPTKTTTTGQIVLGVNGNNSYFNSSGYIGIGTSSPTAKLHVAGNILASGGITMYSDIRKKTRLNDVELTLKQVADAPLIEHYYNSDDKKTTHVGSIAQYWAETIGNDWFCKKDNEGFYTMEIQNAALASAISVARELSRFEDRIERRIRLLEEENRKLREEIDRLKNA